VAIQNGEVEKASGLKAARATVTGAKKLASIVCPHAHEIGEGLGDKVVILRLAVAREQPLRRGIEIEQELALGRIADI